MKPCTVTSFKRVHVSKEHYRCSDLDSEAMIRDSWRVKGVEKLDRITSISTTEATDR